jgi:multicomponent Na+:H+ antiporter subunit G
MTALLEPIGALLLFAGAFFLFSGGLGLVRMPDVFNRIQAGTKATTLGTLLSMIGIACLQPEWIAKLLLIGLFLMFTNPLSSQVLARAAHRTRTRGSKALAADALLEKDGEKSP